MKIITFLICTFAALLMVGCASSSPSLPPQQTSPTVQESQQPFTDTQITTKVKTAFVQEKLFGDKPISAMSINVKTINGVVYLGGTASSQKEVRNAIRIAKSVKGVKRVESRVIVVRPS